MKCDKCDLKYFEVIAFAGRAFLLLTTGSKTAPECFALSVSPHCTFRSSSIACDSAPGRRQPANLRWRRRVLKVNVAERLRWRRSFAQSALTRQERFGESARLLSATAKLVISLQAPSSLEIFKLLASCQQTLQLFFRNAFAHHQRRAAIPSPSHHPKVSTIPFHDVPLPAAQITRRAEARSNGDGIMKSSMKADSTTNSIAAASGTFAGWRCLVGFALQSLVQ